ncbi:hypothetical protein, partial [Desulfobulbus rhabdoformis]|uniref:hypothetical protein n=1 Tax=Desulfobulbus rhabdoformis TaxID=34032 RepID=UPI0019643E8C
MPPPNTPDDKARGSCSPPVPIAGFPFQLEGRRRHSCNEAESSSLKLRPALYLTLRPFPVLLDDSGCPYTPNRRFRGEQAITAGGIAATRTARALPGAQP